MANGAASGVAFSTPGMQPLGYFLASQAVDDIILLASGQSGTSRVVSSVVQVVTSKDKKQANFIGDKVDAGIDIATAFGSPAKLPSLISSTVTKSIDDVDTVIEVVGTISDVNKGLNAFQGLSNE